MGVTEVGWLKKATRKVNAGRQSDVSHEQHERKEVVRTFP